MVEETLVEELEEGELAHISWVSSYDRPLPQVGLITLQKIRPILFEGNSDEVLP